MCGTVFFGTNFVNKGKFSSGDQLDCLYTSCNSKTEEVQPYVINMSTSLIINCPICPLPCPIVLHSSCRPVLLSSCPPVLMYNFPPVLLPYCPHVFLSSCPIVLMSSCPPVLLYSCNPVLLSSCPPVLLPYCSPVLLLSCQRGPVRDYGESPRTVGWICLFQADYQL